MDSPLPQLLPLALIIVSLASSTFGLDLVKFTESDTNSILSPCKDTTVASGDGFTFGLAFNTNASFFLKGVQYSPCDHRLNLSSGQLAMFRPKIDEISLLTINASYLNLDSSGEAIVAFAGSQYAAKSFPYVVISQQHVITSFTLVLDFSKGRLQNLLWKSDGCSSCEGNTDFACLKGQDCAIPLNKCKTLGGNVDCSLSFQTSFSGSDKYDRVFNSWYEIGHLHQYALYGLYSSLKSSLTSQYNKNL